MTVETVKTVGGLVIRPLRLHQQAVLGQYLKQPVPPDLEPAILLTQQQIMQLASAHPRLSQSNLGDPIALVVSQPAYS